MTTNEYRAGLERIDERERIQADQDWFASVKLRSDLTKEQKAEALRIGRLQYVSAGAKRER